MIRIVGSASHGGVVHVRYPAHRAAHRQLTTFGFHRATSGQTAAGRHDSIGAWSWRVHALIWPP